MVAITWSLLFDSLWECATTKRHLASLDVAFFRVELQFRPQSADFQYDVFSLCQSAQIDKTLCDKYKYITQMRNAVGVSADSGWVGWDWHAIQYRALKYVYNDYKSSYADLLERANMPFLFIQRQRVLLMEAFIIYNKHCPLYLLDLLLQTVNEKSLSNNYNLVQPKCVSSTYGLIYFLIMVLGCGTILAMILKERLT